MSFGYQRKKTKKKCVKEEKKMSRHYVSEPLRQEEMKKKVVAHAPFTIIHQPCNGQKFKIYFIYLSFILILEGRPMVNTKNGISEQSSNSR